MNSILHGIIFILTSSSFVTIVTIVFNNCKNSILKWVLKLNFFKTLQVFFLYVCLEKPYTDFLFCYTIVFTLVSLKYVQKKQAKLFDSQFHKKSLQLHSKIKNKHDGGADVDFFVSASITHRLVVSFIFCFLD